MMDSIRFTSSRLLCSASILGVLLIGGAAFAAAPSNDNFASALLIPATSPLPLDVAGTNIGATKEVGEPAHNGDTGGASVWYSWVATANGNFYIDANNSNITTELGVYTGASVNALTPVASGSNVVQFTAVKNTTYFFAVDGASGATGIVSFHLASDIPVITNALTANGNVGEVATIYLSSDNNTPALFTAAPLPPGMTFNQGSGYITGTPTTLGVTDITLTATNTSGSDTKHLIFTVNPSIPPSLSAAPTQFLTVGSSANIFVYSYGTPPVTLTATGLPSGLSISGNSITGTPTAPGISFTSITATNAAGTDTEIISFEVDPAGPATTAPELTSSDGAYGNVGAIFTYYISATGFPAPTFTAAPLPPGLSLVGSQISGTPTTIGTTNVTITATSSAGTATKTVPININAALPPVINTGILSISGTIGLPISRTLFTSSGIAPVTFSTSSALPPGLTLSNNVLSGTPTTLGATAVVLTATNSAGSDTEGALITINPVAATVPPVAPTIVSGTALIATVGENFSFSPAANGTFPISYEVDATPLPPGLSYNSSYISGTPTLPGTFTFKVTATNTQGSDSKIFTITVNPVVQPMLDSGLTLLGTVGESVSYSVYFNGNAGTDTITATGLPPGLVVQNTTIVGTPTTAGTTTASVTATGPTGSDTKPLKIVISPAVPVIAPVITSVLSATGNIGQNFNYYMSSIGTDVVYTISSAQLPPGLTASGSQIYGTPTTVGTTNVTLSATNESGSDTKTLVITINPVIPTAITSPLVATGFVGIPFYYGVSVNSGGFTGLTATNLPPGLVLQSGQIVGSPTTAGSTNVTLTISNSVGTDTKTLVIAVFPPAPPVITNKLSINAYVGSTLSFYASAVGTPNISIGITGSIPPGITNYGSSLYGAPTAPGTYNATITAANGAGTDTKTLVIRVFPALPTSIGTSLVQDGTVGDYLSFSIYTTDSTSINSATAAPLPPGLTLSGTTVSGTPTTAGITQSSLSIVTNNGSDTKTLLFNILPPEAPILSTPLTYSGNVGIALYYGLSTDAGSGTLNYTVSGLPPGITQNGSSLQGTPTMPGAFYPTVTVTNAFGTDTQTAQFVIDPPLPPVFDGDLSPKTIEVGTAFSFPLTATGSGVFTFSATPLPPGIVMTGGGITGVPNTIGLTNVTLTATGIGGTDSATLQINVVAPVAPAITSSLTANGLVGQSFFYKTAASGTDTIYYAANPIPAGLAFYSDGTISGSPLFPGSTTVTLIAANTAGSDSKSLVINIGAIPAPIISSSLSTNGTVGSSFSYGITFSSLGGTPDSYNASPLPPGLLLDLTSARIVGTPTTVGQTNVTLTATNVSGSDTKTLLIDVAAPTPPTFTNLLTASGSVGAYSFFDLFASGSTPQVFSASGIPPGMHLYSFTSFAYLSGTPTTAGTFNTTITVTNASGSDTKTLVYTIGGGVAPSFTSPAMATATVGVYFNFIIEADGSVPMTYTASTLPAGLSLSGNVITGTPTTAGSTNVLVTGTNSGGSANQTISLLVIPPTPPVFTSPLAASGNVDAFFTYTLAASGSEPIQFRDSLLPEGLNFYGDTISGYPTTAGTTNVVIGAVDAFGTDNKTLVITIGPAQPPKITSSLTVTAALNTHFSYNVSATGKSPITYTVANLPPGLTANGGQISGTPTAVGTTNVTLTATNSLGTDTKTLVLTVSATASAPAITSVLTAAGDVGVPFTYTATVTGTSPITFTATPLPAGLSLAQNGLTISGTPTATGITNVTLKGVNSLGTDTKTLVITIGTPPTITSALVVGGSVGAAFSYTITASGSAPIIFGATNLPAGLTFSGNTISGTPTANALTKAVLTASNGVGTDTKTLSIAIGVPVLSNITVSPAFAKTGDTVTFTATATDPANLPLTFSWDPGDGTARISGNPATYVFNAGGTFTVTCFVSNGGQPVFASFPVTIYAPNSGASGVQNFGELNGTGTVTNPLNGISIMLVKSEGGVIELDINIDALNRAAFSVSTEFDGISAVQNTVAGTHVVNKFTNAGIFVATSTATEIATALKKGKARKTLVVSRRETGEAAQVDVPPTAPLSITLKKMTGKLGLAGTSSTGAATAPKPDIVTFTGVFELPEGLDISKSQDLSVSIGNIADQISVDAKGRGTGTSTLSRIKKVQIKYPKLKATTKTPKGMKGQLSLTLLTTNMVNNGFDTEGVVAKPVSKTVNIQFAMLLAGVPYEFTIPTTLKVAPKGDSLSMSAVGH